MSITDRPVGDLIDPAHTIVRAPSAESADPYGVARRRRILHRVAAWSPVVVFLFAWWLAVANEWLDPRLFPPPATVLEDGITLATSGDLLTDLLVTVRRIAVGAGIGVSLGLLTGMFLGRVALARATFFPTISALYTVPKLAVMPLAFLLFGLGEMSKSVVVAFATFIVMVISTTHALANVPRNYLDVGEVFGAKRYRRFAEIILPAALPEIFTALRVSMGMATLMVIGVEFLGAADGIGHLIWNSWTLFRPSEMYVGIVASALLGAVLTALISLAERLLNPAQRMGGRRPKPVAEA